jgi:hypothetical protein
MLSAGTATVLSTEKDTRRSDFTTAARHSAEATAFWGVSGALGGSRGKATEPASTALPLLRKYAARSESLYDVAFLLAIRGRVDLINELSKSRSATDTALAAAALATKRMPLFSRPPYRSRVLAPRSMPLEPWPNLNQRPFYFR